MPRIHRLEHIERLRTPDLADEDSIGAHAQRVPHEHSLRYLASTFRGRWACLKWYDMTLLQAELDRVFDCDDTLAFGDERRQRVEQRRLPCTSAARNHDR